MVSEIFLIVVNLVVGSILLMAGVHFLSTALETVGSDKLKNTFSKKKLTVGRAFLISIVATVLMQSSTAVMIITLSLVNSGLIGLTGAMGIIYGSNIGTTFTAHLFALNLNDFGVLFLVAGILLRFRFKMLGNVLLGIGLIFCGIKVLNYSIPYIQRSKGAYALLIKYKDNVFVGFITGIIVTMLVHSSSATVGLTMVMFNGGLLSFYTAIALILGDNIGTCITSQLASIGSSVGARRTAWAHTIYNIVGSLIVFIFLVPFASIVVFTTKQLGQDSSKLIPNAHTLFNLFSAFIFLPFNSWYVKVIEKFISS